MGLARKRTRERLAVRREPYWQQLSKGNYIEFRRRPDTWIARYRARGIDITVCPLCGGQLRVISDVTDPDFVRKILDHIHQRAPRLVRRPPASS